MSKFSLSLQTKFTQLTIPEPLTHEAPDTVGDGILCYNINWRVAEDSAAAVRRRIPRAKKQITRKTTVQENKQKRRAVLCRQLTSATTRLSLGSRV